MSLQAYIAGIFFLCRMLTTYIDICLAVFYETAGSMDHKHVLKQDVYFFLKKFLPNWLHISCKHAFGSLCISTMWLFNLFLVKRTLKQELKVNETSGKRDQGKFYQHALLHHRAVLHYTSISYSSSSSSFFFSSSSSCFSSLMRFGKPPGPPSSSAGTCRTGAGLLFPQVPKY